MVSQTAELEPIGTSLSPFWFPACRFHRLGFPPALRRRFSNEPTAYCSATADITSGRALHFHPRPLLQQGESRSVIQILLPFFGSHLVNLLDGFEAGQFDARLFGGVAREANVLEHEAERKVGCEVAFQNEGG